MIESYKKIKETLYIINLIWIGFILFYFTCLGEIREFIKTIPTLYYEHDKYFKILNINIILLIFIYIILLVWNIYYTRYNIKKLNISEIDKLNYEYNKTGKFNTVRFIILSSLIGFIAYTYGYFYIKLLINYAFELFTIYKNY